MTSADVRAAGIGGTGRTLNRCTSAPRCPEFKHSHCTAGRCHGGGAVRRAGGLTCRASRSEVPAALWAPAARCGCGGACAWRVQGVTMGGPGGGLYRPRGGGRAGGVGVRFPPRRAAAIPTSAVSDAGPQLPLGRPRVGWPPDLSGDKGRCHQKSRVTWRPAPEKSGAAGAPARTKTTAEAATPTATATKTATAHRGHRSGLREARGWRRGSRRACLRRAAATRACRSRGARRRRGRQHAGAAVA
eukprot:215267-Chlamydomonas_euryale.AAC.6